MKKFYADYLRFAQQLANERGGNVFMEDRMEKDQISVTPYIYNACSANCQFCSELLVRSGSVTVCNGMRRLCGEIQEGAGAHQRNTHIPFPVWQGTHGKQGTARNHIGHREEIPRRGRTHHREGDVL